MVEGQRSGGDEDSGEVYLCPICNTRVGSDARECPGCGAIFVEDDEPPRGDGPPSRPDGASPALEYRCPVCSGTVREDDEVCPNCGAVFVEDEGEAEEEIAPPPAGRREIADEPPPARTPPPREGGAPAQGRAPAPPAGAAAGERASRAVPEETSSWKPPSVLDGLRIPTIGERERAATAAAKKRERAIARHSKAVVALSRRRKLIAQRRMFGLMLLAGGFAVYILSLLMSTGEGLNIANGSVLSLGMVLILLGVLIIYNQYQAWRHYQMQLQTARVEAAILRERVNGGPTERSDDGPGEEFAEEEVAVERPARAEPSRGPRAQERPSRRERPQQPAQTTPVARKAVRTSRRVSRPRTQATKGTAEVEDAAPARKRVVSGAASSSVPPSMARRSTPQVERPPTTSSDEVEKVPCPNCGYMNRSIFVRCIRCGTELATIDDSISVETFERPQARASDDVARPRGGPMPWEARQATMGGRAAARQAARLAAKAEETATDAPTEDRRAAIGVAANFTKLPKNMREELIRTLYKVSDPVVRQDTVSAIAEHYSELPKDIQDLLIDLADDEDPRVREEVAFEVNRNFDRIPLRVIQMIFVKLAKDPENLVREDVVSAIAENYQRLPKETQDLLKSLARDPDESVRDEVSFEVAKNSDVIPEKFKSEVKEILKRAGI